MITLFVVGFLAVLDTSVDDNHRTFSTESRGLVTYTDSSSAQNTKGPVSVQTEVVAEDF